MKPEFIVRVFFVLSLSLQARAGYGTFLGPTTPLSQPGEMVSGQAILDNSNAGRMNSVSTGFEENKGQVRTMNGKPAPYVRYRLSRGNTHIFLLENGIAYQFERSILPQAYDEPLDDAVQDPMRPGELFQFLPNMRVESYRMDMLLEGADPNARVSTEGRSGDYSNYYNHDALGVYSYNRVTYHEVYPGIDWVIYTTEKGLKYNFEIRPGADPALIRLVFKDQEELYLDKKGDLIHGNRMGRFTEKKPVSFQNGNEISTSFVLDRNTIRFKLESFDSSRPLTIDPDRLWATYYGGIENEIGYSCVADGSGDVYLAGTTWSNGSIAVAGHQINIAGASDAFLVKFDENGTRLWGTYYGGEFEDTGTYCAVDLDNNIYLVGATMSPSGIAFNGFQNTFGGGGGGISIPEGDAFLVKFDSTGMRLWATYYGGDDIDSGYSCAVDQMGNVYLSGRALSTEGIAFGGYQNTGSGGFLAKFTSTGLRLWATYCGGEVYSSTVDSDGYVYVAGTTFRVSGVAEGGHQNTYGGNSDAFLVKYAGDGQRLWGTYYGGNSREIGSSCAVDRESNVYLAGSSLWPSGAIASNGHQNTHSGGSGDDGFLAKFNSAGERLWGTYYGGEDRDVGYQCITDADGNVYLAGYTSSTGSIASGGFQNTKGGFVDAYLAKFNSNGIRIWGTYYGGEWDEYGVSCAVDDAGGIYLAGSTESTNAIASNGHQDAFGGGEEGLTGGDAFLVKFSDGFIGIDGNLAVSNGIRWLGQNGSTHQFDIGDNPPDRFELYDASGRFVLSQDLGASSNRLLLDLLGKSPGIYVMCFHVEQMDGAIQIVHR